MALCGKCGNSLGNLSRCSRCGSEDLQELDHFQSGTWAVRDQRSIVGDWDTEATYLPKTPSRASMRDVRREARSRNRRRSTSSLSGPKLTRFPSITAWRSFGFLLLLVLTLYQFVPALFDRFGGGTASTLATASNQIFRSGVQERPNYEGLSSLVVMFLLGIAGYFAIVTIVARSAWRKGRSGVAWFLLAWFFPVVSWLIVASMAPSPEAVANRELRAGRSMRCSNCREIIKRDATICRQCGRPTHR